MDYDIVRTSIQNAYSNYKYNDSKFYDAMEGFYKEGQKNPSVAKILMKDHITKGQLAAKKVMNAAAAISMTDFSTTMYPEIVSQQRGIYNLSITTALKSIEAEDIYEHTLFLDEKYGYLSNKNKEQFDENWKKLYPGTGKIRERIINANRIAADCVKEKAGWFEKINFVKTLAEYKKDYPKTFYARYMLILNGQIEEGKVSSRVSNWFKRFSYKRLIKGGFSFKKG